MPKILGEELLAARIAEDMRMAADHLAGDRVDDVIEREAPLFGSHLRVIDHLEEEVAKLVLERLEILAGDRSATS